MSRSIEDLKSKTNRKISIDLSPASTMSLKELMEKIEENGDIYLKKITDQTQILLIDSKNLTSQRVKQAKTMGVIIMQYDEYLKWE
jgi:hypothetical protein